MIEDESKYSIAFLKSFLINDYYKKRKTNEDDINEEIVKILKAKNNEKDVLGSIKYGIYQRICEGILGQTMIDKLRGEDAVLSNKDFRKDNKSMAFYIKITIQYCNIVLRFLEKFAKHSDLLLNKKENEEEGKQSEEGSKGKEESKSKEIDQGEDGTKSKEANQGQDKNEEDDDSNNSKDNYEEDDCDNLEEKAGRKLFLAFDKQIEDDDKIIVASIRPVINELTKDPTDYLKLFGLLLICENAIELREYIVANTYKLIPTQQLYISKLTIPIEPDSFFYEFLDYVLKRLYTDKEFFLNSCKDDKEIEEMNIAFQKDVEEDNKIHEEKQKKKLEDAKQRHEKEEREKEKREKEKREKEEQKVKDVQDVYTMAFVQEQENLIIKKKGFIEETTTNTLFPDDNNNGEGKDERKTRGETFISDGDLAVINNLRTDSNHEIMDLVLTLKKELVEMKNELSKVKQQLKGRDVMKKELVEVKQQLKGQDVMKKELVEVKQQLKGQENRLSDNDKKINTLTDRINKICIRGVLVNFARFLKFARGKMSGKKYYQCQKYIKFLYDYKDQLNLLAHDTPEELEEVITLNVNAQLKDRKLQDLQPFSDEYITFFKRRLFHDYVIKNHLEYYLDKDDYNQIDSSKVVFNNITN